MTKNTRTTATNSRADEYERLLARALVGETYLGLYIESSPYLKVGDS